MPDDDGKPTFDEIKDAMMPPGTDKDALWAALKGAHRTGGHVPGRPAPDISGTPSPGLLDALRGAGAHAYYTCPICGNAHDKRLTCADPSIRSGTPGWTPFPPAVGSAPADPFSKGDEASAALAEMYEDMLGSGIPLASVERILGTMLAVYGLMTADET